MEFNLINWTNVASIDFGCMPGLTLAGISQNHKGKSFEMNSNGGRKKSFGELWMKPWSKRKKIKKEKNIMHPPSQKPHKKSQWHDGGKKCNDPDPHLRDWITSIQAKSKRRSLAQQT